MIFSLLANSRARSNGILGVKESTTDTARHVVKAKYIPDTFQMHWANFHNMAKLFALENSITSTAGHASYIEQLCTIDHVVICGGGKKSQSKEYLQLTLSSRNELTFSSSYTHSLRFHLVAETPFIFP